MHFLKLFCYCYHAFILLYNLFQLAFYIKYTDFTKKIFLVIGHTVVVTLVLAHICVFLLSEISRLSKSMNTSAKIYFCHHLALFY